MKTENLGKAFGVQEWAGHGLVPNTVYPGQHPGRGWLRIQAAPPVGEAGLPGRPADLAEAPDEG